MPSAPHPARAAALKMLNAVTAEGRLIADLTGQPWMMALAPADRARATRLATETLRSLDRADRVLKPLLRKAPPDDVRHILRLGLVEIAALDGAAHGVVSDMVAAADGSNRTRGFKGMVNAVLRRASESAVGNWGKLPVPVIPKWLRSPLREAYGNSAVQGLEGAHLRSAPLDLTVKSDPEGWAERLGGVVTPTGSVRVRDAGQVSALDGFADGAWWVQDAAAALPARILDPQPGERVADLCAAPGGKTMQLAAAGAQVTAVDGNGDRLVRLRENMERVKLNAEIVESDVRQVSGAFDAVLLDAPCSATGTIRRHPDLPYARDGAGIAGLIKLQAKLLDHALTLLAPGGRLVFCTCSLLPDEGEVQVDDALARHKGLVVDRTALARPGIDPDWITEEGGLRLRPDYWPKTGGMDGFYIACLRFERP
ncbi:MAG: RsmB/NOP family class I SAM-dependent RNA methyltransferase [Pseudomonadota bacterium]